MKLHRNARRSVAFTLPELLVIVAVVLLVVFVVIPNYRLRRGGMPARIKCVNNLKNVGLAFRIFATDHNDVFPFEVSSTNGGTRELHANGDPFYAFLALSNELSTTRILFCPMDKGRKPADSWTNFSNRNVSYFLNTNAVETDRTAFLAGDRNIEYNRKPIPTGRFVVPPGASITFDKRIHESQGNICMADGAVQLLTNGRIQTMTNHTGYVLAAP
jgi:hypothetical protein